MNCEGGGGGDCITSVTNTYAKQNCLRKRVFEIVANYTVRGIEWSLKVSSARKIWPLLDLLAKFRQVLACSCS